MNPCAPKLKNNQKNSVKFSYILLISNSFTYFQINQPHNFPKCHSHPYYRHINYCSKKKNPYQLPAVLYSPHSTVQLEKSPTSQSHSWCPYTGTLPKFHYEAKFKEWRKGGSCAWAHLCLLIYTGKNQSKIFGFTEG